MLDQFKEWYFDNQNSITWFLIGFLIAAALESFSQEQYADMSFSLVLAAANYYLSKK